jgi:hypothetical protein
MGQFEKPLMFHQAVLHSAIECGADAISTFVSAL